MKTSQITYKGKTYSIRELSEKIGMHKSTLSLRLKTMSVEDAVNTPIQKKKRPTKKVTAKLNPYWKKDNLDFVFKNTLKSRCKYSQIL